jgi:predicted nucleic acid-binding protein
MGASSVMKLADALLNVALIGLDTAPIIYFVEANPQYDAIVTEVFQKINDLEIVGLTSVISVTEVLVHPIRQQNLLLKQKYVDILLNNFSFFTKPITASIAEKAAELRAKYNLRTPDALQIATALENGCDAFLCNDNGLKKVSELKILILDEIEL